MRSKFRIKGPRVREPKFHNNHILRWDVGAQHERDREFLEMKKFHEDKNSIKVIKTNGD